MKAAPTVLFVVGMLLVALPDPAAAQLATPSGPNGFTKRSLGENGGSGGNSSVGVVPRKPESTRPIVVELIAVSQVRDWTNAEGKTMSARLLAYSAPKAGETGPVEVIREGRVRFLRTGAKAPIDYPLKQLSQKDQLDIKAIAQAAKRDPGTETAGK